MWVDVVIVTLLLGTCALLKRADWYTRFLTRIRNAGSSWAKAAHDAITHVRPSERAHRRSRPAPAKQHTRAGHGQRPA